MTIHCMIEQPKPELAEDEPVWVSGWSFGTEAVKEVAVSIDNGPFELAQYGHRREGVFALNPDSPYSEYCGFRAGPFVIDARKRSSPSVELVVRVVLETGETADRRKELTITSAADSAAQALLKDHRDKIIARIWRGNDPVLQHPRNLIRADPQGFNSHHLYLTNAIDALVPPLIVEIGVWKGGSTIFMAQHMKARGQSGVVIAVDTWLGSAEHWELDELYKLMSFMNGYPALYHTFIANVIASGVGDRVVPLPMDSLNAAALLSRMNIRPTIIHLDGAHDYASVMADLRAWWPLLLPGGELIGDDYSPLSSWVGVKQAFDEFFGDMGYPPLEYEGPKCRVRKHA